MVSNDQGHNGTGGPLTDTDTVALNVMPVHATNDVWIISSSTPATLPGIALLGNDTDSTGQGLHVVSVTGPATLNPDGTISITTGASLTPTSFDYTVANQSGATSTGHVSVTVIDSSPSTVNLSTYAPYDASYILSGNGQDNVNGTGALDILAGGNGKDTLIGGSGNDILQGGGGNDILDGGAGIDLLDFSDSGGFTFTLLAGLNNTANVSGTDTYSNMEGVIGGNGNDNITGNSGDNVLRGGGGNDTLSGAGGNDTLAGGSGTDTMTGGTGSDRFVFNAGDGAGADSITDFGSAAPGSGGDILDISDLLTGVVVTTANASQYIQLNVSGGNTTVSVDRDGSGSSFTFQDVAILQSVTGLNLNTLITQGNLDTTP